MECCETCRFFYKGQYCGLCRRHAPNNSQSVNLFGFPKIEETDWCGEYKDKEELPTLATGTYRIASNEIKLDTKF